MIASLRGILARKGDDHIIVEVGGLGFGVFVPTSVIEGLGTLGMDISLATHLHVRQNELSLYGFASVEELELFELLLRVSGIGPRMALNAMSFLPLETLREAIASGDTATLIRIPGIGRKVAQRIVLDLRDKVGAALTSEGLGFKGITAAETEVIDGLTALGYSVAEAQEAVRALPDEKLSLEERMLRVLRYLGGGGKD